MYNKTMHSHVFIVSQEEGGLQVIVIKELVIVPNTCLLSEAGVLDKKKSL